ncbi:MAG: hypothetical protein HY719_18025, partial [Planctomycetes bacterium]|nr:hypothetical protein [Planctomycetota bacterium]
RPNEREPWLTIEQGRFGTVGGKRHEEVRVTATGIDLADRGIVDALGHVGEGGALKRALVDGFAPTGRLSKLVFTHRPDPYATGPGATDFEVQADLEDVSLTARDIFPLKVEGLRGRVRVRKSPELLVDIPGVQGRVDGAPDSRLSLRGQVVGGGEGLGYDLLIEGSGLRAGDPLYNALAARRAEGGADPAEAVRALAYDGTLSLAMRVLQPRAPAAAPAEPGKRSAPGPLIVGHLRPEAGAMCWSAFPLPVRKMSGEVGLSLNPFRIELREIAAEVAEGPPGARINHLGGFVDDAGRVDVRFDLAGMALETLYGGRERLAEKHAANQAAAASTDANDAKPVAERPAPAKPDPPADGRRAVGDLLLALECVGQAGGVVRVRLEPIAPAQADRRLLASGVMRLSGADLKAVLPLANLDGVVAFRSLQEPKLLLVNALADVRSGFAAGRPVADVQATLTMHRVPLPNGGQAAGKFPDQIKIGHLQGQLATDAAAVRCGAPAPPTPAAPASPGPLSNIRTLVGDIVSGGAAAVTGAVSHGGHAEAPPRSPGAGGETSDEQTPPWSGFEGWVEAYFPSPFDKDGKPEPKEPVFRSRVRGVDPSARELFYPLPHARELIRLADEAKERPPALTDEERGWADDLRLGIEADPAGREQLQAAMRDESRAHQVRALLADLAKKRAAMAGKGQFDADVRTEGGGFGLAGIVEFRAGNIRPRPGVEPEETRLGEVPIISPMLRALPGHAEQAAIFKKAYINVRLHPTRFSIKKVWFYSDVIAVYADDGRVNYSDLGFYKPMTVNLVWDPGRSLGVTWLFGGFIDNFFTAKVTGSLSNPNFPIPTPFDFLDAPAGIWRLVRKAFGYRGHESEGSE